MGILPARLEPASLDPIAEFELEPDRPEGMRRAGGQSDVLEGEAEALLELGLSLLEHEGRRSSTR
ncbi:MAG: hypothetical protein HY721_11340, partial [Planctomycetes bacterium]|nr:hypothetical protein [Planctomycetota bacterium]